MPKKLRTNPKAEEARERKEAAKNEQKVKVFKEKEDAYWSDEGKTAREKRLKEKEMKKQEEQKKKKKGKKSNQTKGKQATKKKKKKSKRIIKQC